MEQGICKFGEKCLFAHGAQELFNFKPEQNKADKASEGSLDTKSSDKPAIGKEDFVFKNEGKVAPD